VAPRSNGAYLAMARGNPAIYLVTSHGKRWITSRDAMNRFYFAPQQIKYLPLGLLESISSGPNLSRLHPVPVRARRRSRTTRGWTRAARAVCRASRRRVTRIPRRPSAKCCLSGA